MRTCGRGDLITAKEYLDETRLSPHVAIMSRRRASSTMDSSVLPSSSEIGPGRRGQPSDYFRRTIFSPHEEVYDGVDDSTEEDTKENDQELQDTDGDSSSEDSVDMFSERNRVLLGGEALDSAMIQRLQRY